MLYEKLNFSDPLCPVIFHHDETWPEKDFQPHWHESVEILFFLKGEAQVIIDGHSWQFSQGKIAVISSGALHRVASAGELCLYDCLIVDESFLKARGFPVEKIRFSSFFQDEQVAGILRKIALEMDEKGRFYREAVCALIQEMFVRLCREFVLGEISEENRPDMIKQAIRFIHENFDRPLTVTEICRYVGFSRTYFTHMFTSYVGMPPLKYVNWIRLSEARKILSMGECSVSEAARRCGFFTPSYFSKQYRLAMGYSPMEEAVKSKVFLRSGEDCIIMNQKN